MPESVTPNATVGLQPKPWTKVDIIHHLARACGYRSYLEVCTATSGLRYAEIDRALFDPCHRLMYRCPDDFSDGLPVDFLSRNLRIARCLRAIRRRKLRYDIILVDPWHLYDTSYRDMTAALRMVADDGAVVVHDCRPPREEIATTVYTPGDWAGVTYKAYVDFVMTRDYLRYFTVDSDYGCGLIFNRPRPSLLQRWFGARPALSEERERLFSDWRACGNDYKRIYRFFDDNHSALLNLVSVEEFVRMKTLGAGRGRK